MSSSIRFGLALTAALALTPAVAFGQLEDRIFTSGGAPTRGTITQMSKNEVSLDTAAGQRRINVNDITKIQYGGEPGELRSAREQALKGQLEDALEDLNKLGADAGQTAVIRQDIDFYKGYCQGKLALTGGGDKGGAIRALLSFVSNNPENYHFYEAAELLGDLALAVPSYDNALKYYGALANAPWPEYKMKSAVLTAQTHLAKKDYAKALSGYEQVLGMGLDTADANAQKLLARVGKAKCLAETGKPEEGIQIIESVISKNDPQQSPLLFARAYNALGACYRAQKKPKDALLAYLHTDLMFYKDADSHAEALFYLSELWASIQENERSVRARTLLTDRYAGSPWAK